MMIIPTFTIDLDKKCVECGNGGAAASGICLACTTKAISGKKMNSAAGRTVAQRFQKMKNEMSVK